MRGFKDLEFSGCVLAATHFQRLCFFWVLKLKFYQRLGGGGVGETFSTADKFRG